MTPKKSTLYGGETPSGFADSAGKDFAGATPVTRRPAYSRLATSGYGGRPIPLRD